MVAHFRVDPAGERTPLPHVWEHTVGSGRALLALRADWQGQLRRAREELGFRRVRFHCILSDEIGTLVRQHGALLHCDALLDMDVRRKAGAPEYPTRGQVEELDGASRLTEESVTLDGVDGAVLVRIELPPHGVATVTLEGIVP